MVRIELDSATMTFTYQLDGENIGSYTPRNPEKYKDLSFASVVHVDSGSTPNITGYADYVKVGKTGQ